MAAPNIDAVLTELSEDIDKDILRDSLHADPLISLVKEAPYEEGLGKVHSVLTYDRSLPANPVEWSDITTSNNEAGGGCVPPAQTLQITQTLREWNIQHTALHSPFFCTNDLRDAFQAGDQMEQIQAILTENTVDLLGKRVSSEYTRLSQHKVICTLGGLLDDDEWAATAPTSILTQGMLKRVYTKLVRTSGPSNSYGTVDGRPTFLGLGGMEITERLFTEDEFRKDVRESNRVPELLAPLGAERLVRGFWLMDRVFPTRWNLVGGDWEEVPAQIWSGGKLIDNPDYDDAQAEDFVIFSPEVMRFIVPGDQHGVGKATAPGMSYRGKWSWQNIPHATDNPDGNIGRFRGVFQNGSKPRFPKLGWVLRFLRCNVPLEAQTCDES